MSYQISPADPHVAGSRGPVRHPKARRNNTARVLFSLASLPPLLMCIYRIGFDLFLVLLGDEALLRNAGIALVVASWISLVAVVVRAGWVFVKFVIATEARRHRARRKHLAAEHGWSYVRRCTSPASGTHTSAEDAAGAALIPAFHTLHPTKETWSSDDVVYGAWGPMPFVSGTLVIPSSLPLVRSVVVVRLGWQLLRCSIASQSAAATTRERAGFGDLGDVAFESDAFNTRFDVRADDRAAAYRLIDSRMIEYLLAKDAYGFELDGDALVVHCESLTPEQLPYLLDTAWGFVTRIPAAVWRDPAAYPVAPVWSGPPPVLPPPALAGPSHVLPPSAHAP